MTILPATRLARPNRIALLLLLGLGLGSCAGNPHGPRPAGAPVEFLVRFDPPLTRSGTLLIRHESGFKTEVATTTNGVAVRVPPGRAWLRLVIGKEVWEQPVFVRAGEDVVFARGVRTP